MNFQYNFILKHTYVFEREKLKVIHWCHTFSSKFQQYRIMTLKLIKSKHCNTVQYMKLNVVRLSLEQRQTARYATYAATFTLFPVISVAERVI